MFPVDEEEVKFFQGILSHSGDDSPVLDAGCGSGLLAKSLGRQIIGVELLPGKSSDLKFFPIRGDLLTLPCQDGIISCVISRLFGYAYAANKSRNLEILAKELGRVLSPAGTIAIELPVAHQPKKLQGISEKIDSDPGYEFRYYDIIEETPFGAILASEIEVNWEGKAFYIRAPIHVYTPDGVRNWLKISRVEKIRFCAPYDLKTETETPPKDCLRAVVLGTKMA